MHTFMFSSSGSSSSSSSIVTTFYYYQKQQQQQQQQQLLLVVISCSIYVYIQPCIHATLILLRDIGEKDLHCFYIFKILLRGQSIHTAVHTAVSFGNHHIKSHARIYIYVQLVQRQRQERRQIPQYYRLINNYVHIYTYQNQQQFNYRNIDKMKQQNCQNKN